MFIFEFTQISQYFWMIKTKELNNFTAMNISIRKGLKNDLPQVLNLVKELAIYEKAPLEVTVTIDDMERDGFGNNPIFKFFVAEADNKIVGISLYYIKYSTWKGKCVFLEDIIVNEPFRKFGIGKKLFDEVVLIFYLFFIVSRNGVIRFTECHSNKIDHFTEKWPLNIHFS